MVNVWYLLWHLYGFILNSSTVTELHNHTIAKSGNQNWQTYSHAISWSGYKKIFVLISVVSAMQQSALYDRILIGYGPVVQIHWNDGNTGQVTLTSTGISCYAKTQTFTFAIYIYGLK